ncbi:MAG TPA: hypothetical protein DC054_03970 [Blastocatellia bacterium]|nr:hypothetical protein [Blastocatellia bacterium]
MIRIIARSVLAAVLSLAFLGGSFQLAQSASGSLCTLTCCAGRAPHAAGSCMNGSCRAVLKIGRHDHAHVYNQISDQFCGVERVATRKRSLLRVHVSSDQNAQAQSNQKSSHPSTTVAGITKPCDPTCGGGMSISSTQNRPRQSTTAAFADKPRPPTHSQVVASSFTFAKPLNGFSRGGGPRGPPSSSF